MTQPYDIQYFLNVEGDKVLVAGHMTIGRHLDNDLVLAGEDVMDYHLRLELTDRGPWAMPLEEASLRLNDEDRVEPVGLMPGDRLEIGQNAIELHAELIHPPEADEWRLQSAAGRDARLIDGICTVGRSEDSTLQLEDDHVSRHHARLVRWLGVVWIQDLGSANGTFVNGERLTGACQLFHGDEIRFDALGYQLVGRGADLTPVRELGLPLSPLPESRPRESLARPVDTTEFAAVDGSAAAVLQLPDSDETGAFLLGASEPVAGLTFRTPMGRTLIGRHENCDVIIHDRTVSARHAELMVRPEGVTVTNLMATNGTRVNGEEVQTARLQDGDVLRFGRVSLVFKDVPSAAAGRPWLRRVQLALLVTSLILALGLIAFAL